MLDYISRQEADDLLHSTDDNVFLLLDSGRDPELMRTLYTLENSPEFRTLLPMKIYEEAAFKGPLLVRVPKPSDSFLLSYFLDSANLGILLTAKADLDGMTEYCRSLFFQQLDGKALFLRYYDQRVLLPLYLDMEQSNAKSFFGRVINSLLAVEKLDENESDYCGIACYTPEPSWLEGDEPAAFTLTAGNLKAMQATHYARESAALHDEMMKIPAYAAMPEEKRNEFVKNARRDAVMFGFRDLTAQKLFLPLWFFSGDDVRDSAEAMSVLSNPDNSVSHKISLLTDIKMFTSNPYSCPVNPVRILAMNELYTIMPQWTHPDGNRMRLDPSRPDDQIAVRRYIRLYSKYEEDADALVKALNNAVARHVYTSEQLRSNFYHKNNLALEADLVAYLKREMSYD